MCDRRHPIASAETRDETQLTGIKTLRERGELQQILSRYGSIDKDKGPNWDELDIVLEVARAYSLAGNDAKVEQYFLRCAELNPRRAALYRCQIGWFYQRKKRWARAVSWYDRALETFSSYHLCLFRKGYCLERLHRPRTAAAALMAAVESYENAPAEQRERGRGIQVQVLFHLARNWREIGETQRARDALDRCAALDDRVGGTVIKPEHRLASYGETYLAEKDHAAALRYLEEAKELDPNSAVIWERLGRAYHLAGRNEDAEEALRRASKLPKGAVALISLGRFLMASERREEAARTLAEALDRHPQGEVQIRTEVADLQRAIGRPQTALAELERLAAGRVPPSSTLIVAIELRIASILLDHGHLSEAAAHLRAAVANDPEQADNQSLLADTLARLESGEERRNPPRPIVDAPLPAAMQSVLGDQATRVRGEVSSYFPERGYGFISHGGSKQALFFHVSQCERAPGEDIGVGTPVSFLIGVNHRSNKPQAERIQIIGTNQDADALDGDVDADDGASRRAAARRSTLGALPRGQRPA